MLSSHCVKRSWFDLESAIQGIFKSQITIYLVKESKHVSEYVWHGQVEELGEIFKTQSLALEFMSPVPIILQELLWVLTLQPEIKHLHTISTQMEEQTLSAPVIITGYTHGNKAIWFPWTGIAESSHKNEKNKNK